MAVKNMLVLSRPKGHISSSIFMYYTEHILTEKKKKKNGAGNKGMSVDLSLLNPINICVIALGLKHAESIAILN